VVNQPPDGLQFYRPGEVLLFLRDSAGVVDPTQLVADLDTAFQKLPINLFYPRPPSAAAAGAPPVEAVAGIAGVNTPVVPNFSSYAQPADGKPLVIRRGKESRTVHVAYVGGRTTGADPTPLANRGQILTEIEQVATAVRALNDPDVRDQLPQALTDAIGHASPNWLVTAANT